MTKTGGRYLGLYLAMSAAVILLDQVSKRWIIDNLELYGSIPVLSVFSIVHTRNYGAAFGFLNNAGGWQTLVFAVIAIVVSIILLVWLKRAAAVERQLSIALALILGGAIGNLIDRLQYNYVVDFILVYYRDWLFPAFNVADAAIAVGAVLLIMDNFGWKLLADRRIEDA